MNEMTSLETATLYDITLIQVLKNCHKSTILLHDGPWTDTHTHAHLLQFDKTKKSSDEVIACHSHSAVKSWTCVCKKSISAID